ncbi:hypothetical protein Phi13:2_gp049 [Cellulophaga phage phi13:2]|uniref:Uncharacterized protein n=1 Tax=Cellulophaga phage phi13:2 TaxID=1328030 RepID=S0A253_9CAUD|nr:hypothetical protein Phi13:2_gp049 [Cellulophaga phage phi13:2]AGO49659.1 hypothetical protein Phi13:2_gp049 [Cellulophaga phage phi13:2]
MELEVNTTYTRTIKNSKLYFEYLGYSLEGFKRFLVWSDKYPKKEAVSLKDSYIKDMELTK